MLTSMKGSLEIFGFLAGPYILYMIVLPKLEEGFIITFTFVIYHVN